MAQEHYSVEEMESILLDYSICTEDFLDGAICVGGLNRETMERVLFYIPGIEILQRSLRMKSNLKNKLCYSFQTK